MDEWIEYRGNAYRSHVGRAELFFFRTSAIFVVITNLRLVSHSECVIN